MAIAKVSKVLIACHKKELDSLIKETQRAGILHLCKVKKLEEKEEPLRDSLEVIEETIGYLESVQKEKRGLLARKLEVAEADFEKAENEGVFEIIQRIKALREERRTLQEEEREIDNKLALLEPFSNLPNKLEELTSLVGFEALLGSFAKGNLSRAIGELERLEIFLKEIESREGRVFCLLLYPKEKANYIKESLASLGWTSSDLREFKGTVAENIGDLKDKKETIRRRKETIGEGILKLKSQLPLLKISADYYKNLLIRGELKRHLLSTESTILISGWVKERDYPKLRQVVENSETAILHKIRPEEKEEPPIALENRRPFKPFEMVVSLYGMPNYKEIDPTPLLAPFFVIFFGLCLTDAGYGLVSFLLSLFLMKRFPRAKNFFLLVAICSLFACFAGAATNSWFGDIIDRLGLSFLKSLKERLVLFDPFKSPLIFFFISLALGYVHLNYGLLIEIYDSFRIKNPLPALFNEFAWFCILNSILFYILSDKFFPALAPASLVVIALALAAIVALSRFEPAFLTRQILFFFFFASLFLFAGRELTLLPSFFRYFQKIALCLFFILVFLSLRDSYTAKKLGGTKIALYLLAILSFLGTFLGLGSLPFLLLGFLSIFLSPLNRKVLGKILWGFYNLYSGTGLLGIVLSYIRLMALGMVTGGIAVAINTIAWMTIGIPGLGIMLTILILVVGHTYNISINLLGAFVHTLRLNYVEFFPRFFTGGGERFSPLRLETKYVEIR